MAALEKLRKVAGIACVAILFTFKPAYPQSSQEPSEAKTYTLEGRVINAATGNPVSRALVRITSFPEVPSLKAVLTGPDGGFYFAGVAGGPVSLIATKPGFFRPGERIAVVPRPVDIQLGPDTGKIILKLMPEGVIYGQVTGKDGESLEGATIKAIPALMMNGTGEGVAESWFYQAGFLQASPPSSVKTDQDGKFRIPDLGPASYYLMVIPKHFVAKDDRPSGSSQVTYPAIVYYPSATDLDSAKPVKITPGQHVEADFLLTPVTAYKVTGVVLHGKEFALLDPPFVVDSDLTRIFQSHWLDRAAGTFEFEVVPAGTYTLDTPGYFNLEARASSDFYRKLTVDAPIRGLRISLVSREIPVVLRMKSGKEPPAHCVPDEDADPAVPCSQYLVASVELMPAGLYVFESILSSGIENWGKPSVERVTSGKYSVRTTAAPGMYVESVTCGGVDLLTHELVVPDQGEMPPIEVVVGDDPAAIKIHVLSKHAIKSGWVVVLSEKRGWGPAWARLKPGIDEEFSDLAPGDYRIFAFDSNGIDYSDEGFFKRLMKNAKRVTLGPKSSSVVDVELSTKDE